MALKAQLQMLILACFSQITNINIKFCGILILLNQSNNVTKIKTCLWAVLKSV